MNRFEYAVPPTLDRAFDLLGTEWGEGEVIAGGTDLLSLLKDFVVEPKRLVSLVRIEGLRGVRVDGDVLSIGAMTTIDELLASSDLKKRHPALAQAAEGIRSPQIRNMGTVGGELLQRPRCWYFRRGLGLLAQQDGASLAEGGDNRYHAVFGNAGAAKFVSPSSLAPALVALGAEVELKGKAGARTVPVAELFRAPEAEGEREFSLKPGEILTAIRIKNSGANNATYEVRHRHGLDWPEAAAAASLQLDGGKVAKVALVLGHVAPTPWAVDVSGALAGQELTPATADAAATAAVAGATPLSGNAHKVELARVAAKRALLLAAGQRLDGGAR